MIARVYGRWLPTPNDDVDRKAVSSFFQASDNNEAHSREIMRHDGSHRKIDDF